MIAAGIDTGNKLMKKIGFIGNELEKMKKSDETHNASIKCIDWSLDETYIRTIKNFSKVL